MNVGRTSSPLDFGITSPDEQDRKRDRSPSGSPAARPSKQQRSLPGWDEFFNLSAPTSPRPASQSSRPGTPAPRSPRQEPAGSFAAANEEQGLHAETWAEHYRRHFYSGPADFVAPRPETPSDASSTAAEWHRIARPDVKAAFSTLELYDDPDADEATINSMARELLLEFHPDKVAPEGRQAAEEETKKINDARQVAIDYVKGK